MQHNRKPRKHGKPWFVNFSSFSHYYLQHFSKRYVCLTHNSQSIDQNYQRQRLKYVFFVLESKMVHRYQIGNFSVVS